MTYPNYAQVIERTAAMVWDKQAQVLAQKYGLQILNLTWEDTARYQDSAVGPNISDMTIQVQHQHPRTGGYELTCMPVIRYPNFSDRSADCSLDNFFLLVGNEREAALKRVTLRQYLADLRQYLSQPDSWAGKERSLLAQRDTHVLVSAQACFLPISQEGIAEFNPVLFNYQSVEGDPAVLAILVTREGTSCTVIDNQRDRFDAGDTWGQRLFFNHNGERASLTGQRLSNFISNDAASTTDSTDAPNFAQQQGLNLVLLIQVPLKQKEPMFMSSGMVSFCFGEVDFALSNVEDAVIGHGAVEGPFTEIDNLAIERDEGFPIRVTVQFYKATSNGVVTEADMAAIAAQIEQVYANADYVGSLVTEGTTHRPTEYNGGKQQPPDWWQAFWQHYEANTGQSRQQALLKLRRLLGEDWQPQTEAELDEVVKQFKE